MPRQCTICQHPQRVEIDKAIIARTEIDRIAKQFRASRFALKRHKDHVIELVALSPKVEQIAQANSIVDEIIQLHTQAAEILAEARLAKDHRSALAAINSLKNLLEFRAQVSGQLKPHQTNNLHLHLGGERGLDGQLGQLIERARFFPTDRGGEGKALPAPTGT